MKVTRSKNRLYCINLKMGTPICLSSKLDEEAWLWHARLGHLNFDALKSMTHKKLVQGIPRISHASQICDACLLGKHIRAPFPNQAKFKSLKPLDLIYGDLCGPISPPTHSARQLTAPYLPQQNGVVERRNRTMLSTTRSIMKAMLLPQNFWGEAVRHTIYVLNRIPTKALKDATPFEALKGTKPDLRHLKVFGCIAYAKVPSNHLTKLDDISVKMVYLGVEEGSKAYRLFDPITKRICISRDVKFLEKDSWNWKDYMSEVGGEEPEWIDFTIDYNLNETSQSETIPVTTEDLTGNDDQGYQDPITPTSPFTPVTPPTYAY
ncbi:hypothetical protein E3N88_39814 [Mikania micrantha]|uniref:Integrase catalytic domain-containing protein n=1 Tax=Mikania micrantha TaxID=192012 RepID=A0A5N6LL26_9ASTR|nr:hypothetical protein E3N88_39814 [Mikania micrantha]